MNNSINRAKSGQQAASLSVAWQRDVGDNALVCFFYFLQKCNCSICHQNFNMEMLTFQMPLLEKKKSFFLKCFQAEYFSFSLISLKHALMVYKCFLAWKPQE